MTIRILALFCVVLSLALASVAMAMTTYEYSGNNYLVILDNTPPAGTTYTTAMSVDGSFTLASSLASNLAITDIRASVLAYSFTDGAHTLTETNSTILDFRIATDGTGTISDWSLIFEDRPPLGPGDSAGDQSVVITTATASATVEDAAALRECSGVAGGVGGTCGQVGQDSGSIRNNPGSWTLIPEPSAALLFALGLGVVGWRFRRG